MIAFANHEALLNRPGEDGTTPRAHLESLVRQSAYRGDAVAVARYGALIEGPPEPDALGYLYAWSKELLGRSGVGMDGLAPLSYEAIAAWSTLTDQCPTPHEVHALTLLDAVLRHPEPVEDGA